MCIRDSLKAVGEAAAQPKVVQTVIAHFFQKQGWHLDVADTTGKGLC